MGEKNELILLYFNNYPLIVKKENQRILFTT